MATPTKKILRNTSFINEALFPYLTKSTLYHIIPSKTAKNCKKIKIIYKNKSEGELANCVAIKKMKNYFSENKVLASDQTGISLAESSQPTIENILPKKNLLKYKTDKEFVTKILLQQRNKFCHSNLNSNDSYMNNYSSLSRYLNKNSTSSESDQNKIKLEISKLVYQNPFNSLNALAINKLIYKKINENYQENTILKFNRSLSTMNQLLKYNNNYDYKNNRKFFKYKLPPKIRILPFLPKTVNNHSNNINLGIKNIANSFAKILGIEAFLNKNTYLLRNTLKYPYKNFPECRIQFCFAQEGREYILFGGYSSSRNSDIWRFDAINNSWSKIDYHDDGAENRYGHTGVIRYRQLYIFGGRFITNKVHGNLEILNLDSKEWVNVKISHHEYSIPLRKNHIACSIGNQMFVNGGTDEEENFLNDSYLLNYKLLKWFPVNFVDKFRIPALAFHNCCLVVPEHIKNNFRFSIYKYPDDFKEVNENKIKQMGLYVFGGKTSHIDTLNRNLYVLKIGKKNLQWITLKTNGFPPCPRYGFSMSYYESGNFVVIHGGRNAYPLNDTFLLDLYTLNWFEVEYHNKKKIVPGRYYHQAIINGDDLYIFGGTDGKSYLGSEMLIIELNSNMDCVREKDELNYIKMLRGGNNGINQNEQNKSNSVEQKNIDVDEDYGQPKKKVNLFKKVIEYMKRRAAAEKGKK